MRTDLVNIQANIFGPARGGIAWVRASHPARTPRVKTHWRRPGAALGSVLAILAAVLALANPALAQCQVQRLSTDDTAPYYTLNFGSAAAVGESYAVITATFCGFGSIDVCSGYVYAYQLVNGRWLEEVRLSPSDGTLTDVFGESVSVSGERIIVGARAGGGAYIFHRTETRWIEEAKLLQWDDDPFFDAFGQTVAISGNVALVGDEEGGEEGGSGGAAYVFRRTELGWAPEQKLTASDGSTLGAAFGRSLSADGDYIAVGDPGHDASGMVYVFHYDGDHWSEQDRIIGSDTRLQDAFGNRTVLRGDRMLVGAPYHDDPADNIGAAYVFRREGSEWVQEAKLLPQDAQSGDLIGAAIAFNGQSALLRGFKEHGSSVNLFERTETSWTEKCRLSAGATPKALGSSYGLLGHAGDVLVYTLSGPCHSLANYAALQRCFSDEGALVPLSCEDFDVDLDGDVALDDYRRFREHLVGPGDSCQ